MRRHRKMIIILLICALFLCSCSSPTVISQDGIILPSEDDTEPVTPELIADTDIRSNAVALPDLTRVPEAVPIESAVFMAFEAQSETQSPAADTVPAETPEADINSYMLVPSGKKSTYTLDKQEASGSLLILGPNLIYIGESFDFGCYYPDRNKDSVIRWSVDGVCGEIDKKGVFKAVSKGVVTVRATDLTTGTYAALHVHCIADADEVDFIPLVNNIPIANKTYPLPKDYDPGIDPDARDAFVRMQNAAKKEGLSIYPISAYRSYDYQTKVYAGWKAKYGSYADSVSARPGFSEHQLGLAFDVNLCQNSFANTAEYRWLKKHCAEYGFILRYPDNESSEYTGYAYEPWHIRYIGKALAEKVTKSVKTLEELLGIDSRYR
ncbi:MAG: M15 family metallopeptidase [Ruminiclostridium sp.]|nr:M15 family metallopeptidase [Ruminiclostridium sp.]